VYIDYIYDCKWRWRWQETVQVNYFILNKISLYSK
jgi:hypothetical protein